MPEHRQRNTADRALSHAHEDDVAQFGKQGVGQAQCAVNHQQGQRQYQRGLARIKLIDNLLHHQRHADVGDFCRDEKYQCQQHAAAIFPQIRQNHGDRAPFIAAFSGLWRIGAAG